ncbi:disease resistance protein L6-like [Telopea speciosissima]|uniref:disease resistance protein L6-like n=1 Tax=Telopea speciosissima TaxID=54955 RepID=UPI001CC35923|nr:disease resistance protein L6-like [Telopea speciosissima]
MHTAKRKFDAISSATEEFCDSSSSSSSVPSSGSGWDYEVFLSFRGETRTNFTDHLYNALLDNGIHTFRDNEELPIGEKIGPALLSAIHQSKIAIIIFSKGYASSKWCLLELAEIAECMKRQIKVMPVFYHVMPSDVRNQTGSYENAFLDHEKKYDQETVERWKKALREVGELKGWDLENVADGHEGKSIKLIVKEVWSELRKSPLTVSNNMVGIHSHVEKMMKLLNIASKDRRIVGIHGLGGIGKTTIARCVYNTVYHHFEGCSFIADVRETFQTRGAVHLQSQLVTNILNIENPNITSVDQGIDVIKQRLSNKKILIVFDDVDENTDLNAIIGERDWFGFGSKIIITTRDRHILDVLEVDEMYEPNEMDSDQSLKLFSKHAFKMDRPPENYLVLSKDVVKTTGGLPLALEVIGSYLFRKGESAWKDTVKKLAKIPNNVVQKKLRISYEGLTYEEKEMFLDIACFFIGMDKNIAFYIWNGCDFFPGDGIENLCLKSLVKIGEENELRMHDQLRDLGREIVRQENLKELGQRSRLWSHEEVLEVLSTQQGTRKVEGLCSTFYGRGNSQCMMSEGFATITKLRLLQVDFAEVAGNFMHSFPELRWLSWKRCTMQFTPTNLRKLCVLDLSHSDITESWRGWNYIKEAETLKVLNLSWCYKLSRTPDLSENIQLEELILEHCENLATIDASIGHLKRLVILKMKGCKSQSMYLPTSICELSALKTLDIRDARISQLPETLGRLEALTELYVDFSEMRLPSSIRRLKNLKILSTDRCVDWRGLLDSDMELEMDLPEELPPSLKYLDASGCRMKSLPWLSNLTNLEVLYLNDCPNLVEIPTTINALTRLESLALGGCPHLRCISNLPSGLKILEVSYCENMIEISGFSSSGMRNLEKLSIYTCPRLEKIESLEGLDSLQQFVISGCCSLRKLPKLLGLKKLRHLEFKYVGLYEIEVLEGFYSLKNLIIEDIQLLRIIPNLSDSKNLVCIEIQDCDELFEIESLEGLDSLEKLSISDCPSLRKIQVPKKLCELHITECDMLSEIEGLKGLNSLEKLSISECPSLPKVQLPKKLCELYIKECDKLSEIEGLEDLESLTIFCLHSCCESIIRLPNLSNLKALKDLSTCALPLEINCFEGLESLQTLTLFRSKSLEVLPDVSPLKNLKRLELTECEKLTEILSVGRLESLEVLDVQTCESVEILPDILNLTKLRELHIQGCKKLTEIQGVDRLEILEVLRITRCISIETLPCLSKLKNLRTLSAVSCKKLTEIQGVEELESLEEFDISGCISMEKLPCPKLKKKKKRTTESYESYLLSSSKWDHVPPVKELWKLLRIQALRCHVIYCQNGTKLHAIQCIDILEQVRIYCNSIHVMEIYLLLKNSLSSLGLGTDNGSRLRVQNLDQVKSFGTEAAHF